MGVLDMISMGSCCTTFVEDNIDEGGKWKTRYSLNSEVVSVFISLIKLFKKKLKNFTVGLRHRFQFKWR